LMSDSSDKTKSNMMSSGAKVPEPANILGPVSVVDGKKADPYLAPERLWFVKDQKAFSKDQEDYLIELAHDPRCTIKKLRDSIKCSSQSFYTLIDRSPLFASRLSRARNESLEDLADSLLTILDDEPDTLRARLKSENIKWILSKRKPSTYGDKLEVSVNQTIDISQALSDARNRAQLPIIKQKDIIDVESHTITTDSQSVEDIFS
jgi:hypothetical protein